MAGRPARKLSVYCAVSRSGRAICEKSGRGSPTVIMIATPITAEAPSRFSKIMREHREQASPHRVTERPAAASPAKSAERSNHPTAGANLRDRWKGHCNENRYLEPQHTRPDGLALGRSGNLRWPTGMPRL